MPATVIHGPAALQNQCTPSSQTVSLPSLSNITKADCIAHSDSSRKLQYAASSSVGEQIDSPEELVLGALSTLGVSRREESEAIVQDALSELELGC